MSTLHERYVASVMNTFGPPKLVLERGEGARVWDTDGNEYLDLLAGIAVNALGHCHPAWVNAITEQASTLGHISNFFTSRPQVELAERLLAMAAPGGAPEGSRVFFANSGTEANEAAFKMARRTGRTRLVVAEGSFHGRTMGSLALTSKAAYREPFEPLPGNVTFVPYADSDALAAAVNDDTAAVVLEPVQGEAGVVLPPRDYLAAARRIATEHGALLWLDEVQTGIGRTGTWLAHQNPGRRPGDPRRDHARQGSRRRLPDRRLYRPGESGPTPRARHPRHHLRRQPGRVRRRARRPRHHRGRGHPRPRRRGGRGAARAAAADAEGVTEVTGRGLMLGVQLDGDYAPHAVTAGQQAGFILTATGPSRIRLVPPLVLGTDDVTRFAQAWPGILAAARKAAS